MSENESKEEKTRGSNKEREKEIQDLTLESYYKDLKSDRPDKDTAGIYRETFIYLEEWIQDKNSIDSWRDLQPEHLSLFRSHLKDDEGLSGLTRKQHFQRLRSFFRDQDDTEELVEKINGWKFERQTLEAKETNNEVNFLTIPEYQKIVDACQSTREELIIRGLWELGIRRAEFAELKIDHLNRDIQTVDVDNKELEDPRDTIFRGIETCTI
ncbi:site-specific integrase [Haloarcula regularis]|uniref:phage integrase SAM-like domain-containing protein n=1 Tax=Haloarcula regularis TaxID=3033392 RepID=UPI0023E80EF7|nr:phage integrase SAM-like domain-containing protein [Halomicroarcula sp. SYNS111]